MSLLLFGASFSNRDMIFIAFNINLTLELRLDL